MTRAALVLLALFLVATAVGVPGASAQAQEPDLNELWQRYPLDPTEKGPRNFGGREEDGSTARPPPEPPGRAGPFPLALLFLALALAVVAVAGAVRQAVLGLRARRQSESRRLGAGAGDLGG